MRPDRSATRADRLRRESGGEVESPLYPAGERIISRIACRFDAYEAGQDPAVEEHRPYVRLAQRLLAAFSTDPDHQRHAGDATADIAVDREREAADHLSSPRRRDRAAVAARARQPQDQSPSVGASSRYPPRFFTTRCAVILPDKILPPCQPTAPHAAARARRCPVSGLADLRIWKTPGVDSRILLICASLVVCSYGRVAGLFGSVPA